MGDSQNIQLISKTFDVISLLVAEGHALRVSEISRKLKMVKSGTYRILNTLKEQDLVYQNPRDRTYSLGLKFYVIGTAVQKSLPLYKLARRYLDPLGSKYSACFELLILYPQYTEELSAVVIYSCGNAPIIKGTPFNSLRRPLHVTAAGKAILAFSSSSELISFKAYELNSYTAKSIITWDKLTEELEEIRELGYAQALDEYVEGVSSIAVPVSDSMHSLIGAVCMCCSSQVLEKMPRSRIVADLKIASRAIGRNC